VSAAPGGAPFTDIGFEAQPGQQGSVTDDGRYVVFAGSGAGLLLGDPSRGVYVKDLSTGEVTLVSRRPGASGEPLTDTGLAAVGIDDAGTRVAFTTALPLVPADTNGSSDVYVRTLATGATQLGSLDQTGVAIGDIDPGAVVFAGDGTAVAFTTNRGIAGTDLNATSDVYVASLTAGTVALGSRTPAGTALLAGGPSISDNGRRVAFVALGSGGSYDTNGVLDAYVYDLDANTLELGSRQNGVGGQASAAGNTTQVALAGDGGTVAFSSSGTDYSDGGTGVDVHRHILGTTVTQLVSRADGPSGTAANAASGNPSISDGGNVIAYTSLATNLDAEASEAASTMDVFIRRAVAGETERVSRRDDGSAFARSGVPNLAGSAQHVVIPVAADGLLPGGASDLDPTRSHLVLRDLSVTPRRTRSVSRPAGSEGRIAPLRRVYGRPDISENGRYVAFVADAPGYLPGAASSFGVFRRDLRTGAIDVVSYAPDGTLVATRALSSPSISADGMRIAFASGGAPSGPTLQDGIIGQVYVRDLAAGTTVAADARTGEDGSTNNAGGPVISADGRRVAFLTRALLDPADPSAVPSAYVRDLASRTTTLVSRADGAGGAGNAVGVNELAIDGDGSRVAFTSIWNGFGNGASGASVQVHVRDLETGRTLLASSTPAGVQGDDNSQQPYLDAAGARVAFTTEANLAPGHVSGLYDAVIKDLGTGSVEQLAVRPDGGPRTEDAEVRDLSPDGRHALVATEQRLDGTVATVDENLYARDRSASVSRLVSRLDGAGGAPLEDRIDGASIDASGACVAFLTDERPLTNSLGEARAYVRATTADCPPPAAATGAGTPSGGGGASSGTPTLRLTGLAISPKRPRSGKAFAIRFSLSAAADVAVRIERVLPGRQRKGRCTTPARAPRGKRCSRLQLAGTLTAKGLGAGAGQVRFRGTFGRKRLAAGKYRVTVTATPPGGPSARATASLTVLKAAAR
jgi:Tol biopolymer transport system component